MERKTFVAPAADPHFANSAMHGAQAQEAFLRKVYPYCRDFRTALDVGAHIGLCTVALAAKFKEVHAFEPQAENFKCLQINAGKRAEIYNVCVGRQRGRARMALLTGANSGMWHSVEGDDVDVVPLDTFNFDNVDLIKIDTEGFEGEVIAGAEVTIKRCKPAIVFEDNGLGAKHYGSVWVDPKPLLVSLGYSRRVRLNKDEVWTCK